MQQAFSWKKKSHYNGIIDSDFEMIKEKWLPGADIGGEFETYISFYLALIHQNGQHSFYVLSISFNLVLVLANFVREIQRSEISDFACIILYFL